MMATSGHFCTLCLEDGVSSDAILWCSECETFLCTGCATHHGRIKASKMHDVVTVDEVKKLPAFVMETGNKCDAHERMNEFYCQVHQIACCVHCIKSDHKDCRELVPLSDVLTDIKSSAAVGHLEADITKLKSNYEIAMAAISDKIKNIESEKFKCIEEIRRVRQKINSHLDELENKLQEELSSTSSKFIRNMQTLQEEMTTKLANIQQIERDFDQIKMYGTNLQAFSALKSFEQLTKVEFKFLCEMQADNNLGKISAKIDTSPLSNISEMKIFGTLMITEDTNYVIFDTEKTVQIPKSTTSMDTIHPRFVSDLRVHPVNKVNIRNCLICPNGEKIIVDQSNNKLVRFSNDNSFIDKISLVHIPCDICHFESNIVAVTSYNEKRISIIELSSRKTISVINVPYKCYGIDFVDQHFYVSFANEGEIGILDSNGSLQSTVSICGKNTREIVVSDGRIYGSDSRLNTVSCYLLNGKVLWTYKHNDILTPHGLSIDKNAFVYVACSQSNKIIVISPDGKTSKVILTDLNGVDKPFALHLNKQLSLLLVGNWTSGGVLLFEL